MEKEENIQLQIDDIIDSIKLGLMANTEYFNMHTEIYASVENIERGCAWTNPYRFSIPYWAYDPDFIRNRESDGGYLIYYIAHELAHILAHIKFGVSTCDHGDLFCEMFRDLCPEEFHGFEFE